MRRSFTHLLAIATIQASMAVASMAVAQQAATSRPFDTDNSPTGAWPYADWAYGRYKAECASGGSAVGLSRLPSTNRAHSVLCKSQLSPSGPLNFYDAGFDTAHAATSTQVFSENNSTGYGPRGDWDYGYYKGECPYDQFVTGVSQNPSTGKIDKIECSIDSTPGGPWVPRGTCNLVAFPGNHPSNIPDGDWAYGYDKLECASGQVMVGVSVTNNAAQTPHGILCCNLQQGLWTKAPALFAGQGPIASMQLLMDGTILMSDGYIDPFPGETSRLMYWYRYSPSSDGHYSSGSWRFTQIKSHYGRRAYATGMLTTGKLFVGGGEYLWFADGSPNRDPFGRSFCEVFDPQGNGGDGKWSDIPNFAGSTVLADGTAVPLPNGRLLVAPPTESNGDHATKSMELDPVTLTWVHQTTLGGGMLFGEGSFAPLQDGLNIVFAQNGVAKYGGTLSQWNTEAQGWTTVAAPWPTGSNPYDVTDGEGGPALTLYDGRVLILGSSGFNGIYDPALGISNTGQALGTQGVDPPGRFAETNQALMPTGNALCAGNHSSQPNVVFYEFDPSTGTFSTKSTATGAPAFPAFSTVLQTPLPDGSIMVSSMSSINLYIYTPRGPQLTQYGQPTITSPITGPVNGVYTLNGTTLSGLTNGASMDDELQNYTSFPIVAVEINGTKTYCSVTSVSNMSITPGVPSQVKFTIPPGVAHGALKVTVSASGLQSSNSVGLNY